MIYSGPNLSPCKNIRSHVKTLLFFLRFALIITRCLSQLAYLQSSLDKLSEAIKLAKVDLWGFGCSSVAAAFWSLILVPLLRVSPTACRRL